MPLHPLALAAALTLAASPALADFCGDLGRTAQRMAEARDAGITDEQAAAYNAEYAGDDAFVLAVTNALWDSIRSDSDNPVSIRLRVEVACRSAEQEG